MIFDVIWIEGAITLELPQIIVFLLLFSGFINSPKLLIHELRLCVEFGKVVWVICRLTTKLSDKILLVKPKLFVSKDWILWRHIRIFLCIDYLACALINIISKFFGESHLSVKDSRDTEFSDKSLPFFHDQPW